jgi:hypothetical protein
MMEPSLPRCPEELKDAPFVEVVRALQPEIDAWVEAEAGLRPLSTYVMASTDSILRVVLEPCCRPGPFLNVVLRDSAGALGVRKAGEAPDDGDITLLAISNESGPARMARDLFLHAVDPELGRAPMRSHREEIVLVDGAQGFRRLIGARPLELARLGDAQVGGFGGIGGRCEVASRDAEARWGFARPDRQAHGRQIALLGDLLREVHRLARDPETEDGVSRTCQLLGVPLDVPVFIPGRSTRARRGSHSWQHPDGGGKRP